MPWECCTCRDNFQEVLKQYFGAPALGVGGRIGKSGISYGKGEGHLVMLL